MCTEINRFNWNNQLFSYSGHNVTDTPNTPPCNSTGYMAAQINMRNLLNATFHLDLRRSRNFQSNPTCLGGPLRIQIDSKNHTCWGQITQEKCMRPKRNRHQSDVYTAVLVGF